MHANRLRIPFMLSAILGAFLVAALQPFSADAAEKGKVKKQAAYTSAQLKDSKFVSREADRLLSAEFKQAKMVVSEKTTDEDFLRRVSFDLAGSVPSPQHVTFFGLTPDKKKREKLIDQLLDSNQFAENWARYWRDVIFSRATDPRSRIAIGTFESWMTEQLRKNAAWGDIVTELLTASGDVRENGETALMMAHQGQPAELASETSRIFMGIQMQCANCHDHPTDQWKREQFHELAAYFPRVRIRRVRTEERRSFEVVSFNTSPRGRGNPFKNPQFLLRRFDSNRDGKLTKSEVSEAQNLARFFDRLLEVGDKNGDKALSAAEMKNLPAPQMGNRNTNTEYFMPDLNDPGSEGEKIEPAFFIGNIETRSGLNDIDRREILANILTSRNNVWFARAFVNRIWAEMLGEGFYMPVDDIGPERQARFPQVLELLSQAFTANSYDMKWLFRVIANTEAYQRQIRSRDLGDQSPPFASAVPTRLRSDQLYNAFTEVLGVNNLGGGSPPARGQGGGYRGVRSARGQFNQLFGFDPSTAQEDITGNIPQALFMMNSPILNNLIRSNGETRLAEILDDFPKDEDALNELYLLVLAREPSEKEFKICLKYIEKTGNRGEAFEDLQWSLMNSSEFLSKR